MKKSIALILMIAMVIVMVSGCRGAEEEQLGIIGGDSSVEMENDPLFGIGDDSEEDQEETPSEEKEPLQENKPSDQKNEESSSNTQPPKEETPSKQEQPKQEQEEQEQSKEEPEEQEQAPIDYSSWIKVASYNIKALNYNAKDPSMGADQFDAVVAELKKIDADIVGLQEVDRYSPRKNADQVKDLAQALGYPYYKYTKTIDYGSGEYGHAIMSRYPILSSKSYAFADAPGSIDAAEPRAFSRHVLKIDGKHLVFYNGHLAEKTPNQLMYMVENFMAKDLKSGLPIVMTADFNATPQGLIGCFDLDQYTLLNGGDDFENALGTTNDNNVPIDNILVSDSLNYYWDAKKKCGIEVVDSLASDHKPIYTYINFK